MTTKTDRPDAVLAALQGRQPEWPDWFAWALAQEPEIASIMCEGVALDTRAWGDPGKPGLLFLHGFTAHADWWSFIAPFFADRYRVVAFSWSGMGMSGWRDSYAIETYQQEIDAVGEATGLFQHKCKPIVVAHSFGSFPALAYAAVLGRKLLGAISMDTPLFTLEERQARARPRRDPVDIRANKLYPTLEQALARFRFTPVQPCDNLYIADYIARRALRRVDTSVDALGGGYRWSFDPGLWRDIKRGDPTLDVLAAQCPLAFIRGADSTLMTPDVRGRIRDVAPTGSPMFGVPGARHHLMVDQPLALISGLRGLLSCWPQSAS